MLAFPVLINAQEVDFLQERLALAEDSSYEPYTLYLIQIGLLEEHHKQLSNPTASLTDINKPLQELSELYPLSIQANFAIARLLEYVAEHSEDKGQVSSLQKTAQIKQNKAQAILDSILTSGDGVSRETAYRVINLAEEDAVLSHLGLTKISQVTLGQEGENFDVLSTKNSSGKEKEVYFNVSLFYEK